MQRLFRTLFASALVAGSLVAGTFAAATDARAQSNWPNAKQITIIHPFAAGSDLVMRMVAAALEQRLGQKVLIENRPGAGGATGTGYAARQTPDGYTLVTALPGPAANHTNTFSGLPYKPLNDFEHISQLTVSDIALMARKDFPANNMEELIAYAKANPGKVSVGNNGPGSYGHMIALMLADKAGVQLKHVPYRGGAQVVTDLMSGSLDLSSDYFGSAYSKHVAAGTIKVIAVASEKRTKALPNAPTFKEAGIEITVAPWMGIMAPKGTPRPIIDKINAALKDYLATEDARAKLDSIGQMPAYTTPEAFHDIVVREEAMWRDTIKNHNIRNE